jgi:putative ABC transport system permease protein
MQSTNEGALIPGAGGGAGQSFKRVKMAPKLAYRNLFHDRLSLFVTLIGIVFSVVLVAIQCGLYLGSERTIAAVIDQAKADLWVVPIGTKSFDDASLLTGREKYAVLGTPGVESVEELVIGFAGWRKPEGGKKAFILVGSDWKNGGLAPWNIEQGSLADLDTPNSVAVDKSYFPDLGITAVGQSAEINSQKVTVAAVTTGIRSFTTLPYVFTSINRARQLVGAAPEQSSYQLVRVTPGVSVDEVQKTLAARLPDTEVLKHADFRDRSLKYWLFKTGAGGALIAGAVLGIIVGVVIVAQTLYSSTKDHLNEFATLRALGASASYIHAVILIQAMLSAIIGYAAGISLSLLAILATKKTTLTVVMTPTLAMWLFALTLGMCIIAAISAIFKVTRIDPAGVFSR